MLTIDINPDVILPAIDLPKMPKNIPEQRCRLNPGACETENSTDYSYPFNRATHGRGSGCAITYTYTNTSDRELYITDRSNLPILAPVVNSSTARPGLLTIYKAIVLDNRMMIGRTTGTIAASMAAFVNTADDLMPIFRQLERANVVNDMWTHVRIVLSYDVNVKTQLAGGEVYLNDLDLMVTDAEHLNKRPHPYSHGAQLNREAMTLSEGRKVSGVFVELIDNNSDVTKRYMVMAKQLMEIPVQKNPARNSGVYITHVNYAGLDTAHVKPGFSTFEEAEEKFGLYRTKEEAISGGIPELLMKVEEGSMKKDLLEQTHASQVELITLKREFAEMQALYEKESARRKAALDEFEHNLRLKAAELKNLEIDRAAVREVGAFDQDQERLRLEAERQRLKDKVEKKARKIEEKQLKKKKKFEKEKRKIEKERIEREAEVAANELRRKEEHDKLVREWEAERLRRNEEYDKRNKDMELQQRLRLDELERRAKERTDHYNHRAALRDDYYEDRSKFRKDSSELIKWGPTIVAGAATLAGAFYLLGNNNKQ